MTEAYDWFEREGYEDEIIEPVDIRMLCEQDTLILRFDRIYKFKVDENCTKCMELAKVYGYKKHD